MCVAQQLLPSTPTTSPRLLHGGDASHFSTALPLFILLLLTDHCALELHDTHTLTMSGVQGHILGHLAKRGYEAAQQHIRGPSPDMMAKLQHDAQLYDQSGPEMEVSGWEMLPVIVTGFLTLLLVASVCPSA